MRRTLIVALPLLAACYRYAPADQGLLQPGTDVRARITAAAAEQIEPLLGTTDARVLTGVVVNAGADTLLVEVPTAARSNVGNQVVTLKQRVSVPRTSIIEIETRELDKMRTGMIVGPAAAIAVALLLKTVYGEPGDARTPPGGELPEFRAGLLRIRF